MANDSICSASGVKRPASMVGGLVLLMLLGPGSAQAADARNGAKLYNTHCSSCHGAKGRSTTPGVDDFSRSRTLYKPDRPLVEVIENGAGIMPAYRGLFSTNDILDVVAYMRTFQ